MAIETYIGSGNVIVRPYGTRVAWEQVGNCSQLSLDISEDEKKLANFRTPGGGTYDKVTRIDSVAVSLTLHELTTGNLMRALYAGSRTLPKEDVASEKQQARKGAVTLLDRMPLAITSVKQGATNLEAGVDYVLSGGGIAIPDGSKVADDSELTFAYTAAAVDIIEALTKSAGSYEMAFEGMNEAGTGKRCNVRFWKTQFGPASGLDFIGDDFLSLDVSAELLLDTGRSLAADRSGYFRVEKERADA